MAMSAYHIKSWVLNIGQNLQPITGSGDISIWVKNSQVGRKTTHKQTIIKT